jgi:hypothetical protein
MKTTGPMKVITLVGVMLLCFIHTFAATITHTATIFPSTTDWSVTNSVPQFDPSLGTLTNVTITIGVNAKTTIRVENRDRTPWLTTAGSEVTATATVAGYSALTTVTNSHTQTLTSFDGTIDYAGTSGLTQSIVGSDYASESVPTAAFVGIGNVPLVAGASAVGRYNGSGYYRFIVNTSASALVTVTYEFSPPVCPECPPACKPDVNGSDDDNRRKKSKGRR